MQYNFIRTLIAPKPNRTPLHCARCGTRVAWNQSRTSFDAQRGRIKVCWKCK